MPKVKIFVKELEFVDVLEVHINKFIENIDVTDIKTSIGKNKFGDSVLIVCILYEDYEEDLEIDSEEEEKSS